MRLTILAGLGSPWSYAAIEAIADQGVEVHVIHIRPEAHQAYIDPGSDQWRARIAQLESKVKSRVEPQLGAGKLRYLGLAKWLKSHFLEIKPDVVLSLYAGGMGLAAVRSGASKVAIYTVGSDILALRPPYTWLSRKTLSSAQLVLANGAYLAERTRLLAPIANVKELLLGVDTQRFTPGEASDVVRLISTRGFQPVYNNLTILKALALLPSDLPEWHFTFVAGGDLLAEAQQWAEANLTSTQRARVQFLGGVGPDALLQQLQQSDVFISMSLSDGTATSLLEAMSCGLFPILSDIPPNRPWAEAEFLVPLRDPVALARAIARIIEEPKLRGDARSRIRDRIVKEADSRANMSTLVEILSEL